MEDRNNIISSTDSTDVTQVHRMLKRFKIIFRQIAQRRTATESWPTPYESAPIDSPRLVLLDESGEMRHRHALWSSVRTGEQGCQE